MTQGVGGNDQRAGLGVPSVVVAKVRIPTTSSMPVERLDALIEQVWRHRLALIVAPAGSGKTTLASRFAARAPGPVGWYRAEALDRDESTLLRHLQAALAPAVAAASETWESVADAANALDAWPGEPILLVVDDLHTLEGTPAEAALERLVDYAPASLTVLAASRVPPAFNLPRLRVSGTLLELSGEDLRFRSWEVERLFRDFYQEPLPPEELARLARQTEGWAAGLQLFHLATRGKPPDERRRVLSALGPGSRLMRDYLSRNVLEALPADLRRFLVDTSVLGRLSASLCDALLGGAGTSAEHLEELERRNVFTQALPEDGAYRYHEVLRAYLQGVLLAELGDARVRERFRTAGRLLAESGALPEALEAYVQAGDGDAARRLLGTDGEAVAGRSSAWLHALPATMLLHDPWLLLASARQLRAEGRFAAAVERYERAERAFGSLDPAHACRDERQAITVWLDPARTPRRDPAALLRAAVRRDPLAVVREADAAADVATGYAYGPPARGQAGQSGRAGPVGQAGQSGRAGPVGQTGPVGQAGSAAEHAPGRAAPAGGSTLVAALATLLAGDVRSARARLSAIADDEGVAPAIGMVAALAAGVAGVLAGDRHGTVEVLGAVAAAESLGLDWLARVGRATLALAGGEDARREAMAVADVSASAGDAWGEALARWCICWNAVADGDPDAAATADRLAGMLRGLDAGVLEAWVRGLGAVALARSGAPEAHDVALQAEAVARNVGVGAVRALTSIALAETTGDPSYRDHAESIARETGLAVPQPRPTAVQRAANAEAGRWVNGTGYATGNEHAGGPTNGRANGHDGTNEHAGAPAAGQANGHSGAIGHAATPPLRIRLLGGYELEIDGRPVDLAAVRPRVRTLLRLLSLHAGAPVHHETIEVALWPGADREVGSRNLHTAVAAVRRAVEPDAVRGAFQLVRREGDAYRLVLPAGAEVDLHRFDAALVAGRAAAERGDIASAVPALDAALAAYRGELLPEDGPADWVVVRREECRLAAVAAAQALAEVLLAAGDAPGAARASADGLRIERYHDPLWRLLIEARDRAGDQAAATRARSGYDRMLAELGVSGGP